MGLPTIHVRRGRWRDWGGGYTKHVEDLASQMGRVCTAGTVDHRTTPDLRLPGKPTPFRLFFGRDARTQLDATHPEIDGGDFRGGMHSYVADKRQAYKEVRDVRVALLKRQEDRQKSRESRNAEIGRTSVGTRVVVGDKVLVKEAESVMAREGIHHNLAHEHWTGPWEVTEVVLPGLSYIVTMSGRGIRR